MTTNLSGEHSIPNYPSPPSLHWAGLLLLHFPTLGFFTLFWMFRQAMWVRRIDPASKAVYLLAASLLVAVLLAVIALQFDNEGAIALARLAGRLGFAGVLVWSYLWMRRSIESEFNLTLSGIMTVLFGVFYLQYHLRRIAKGEHTPEYQGWLR